MVRDSVSSVPDDHAFPDPRNEIGALLTVKYGGQNHTRDWEESVHGT